jgi:hypothetical protein
VSTRLELRREFTRRREDERREITDEIRKNLAEEGVLAQAEVARLRFRVETTEARIKQEWERSNQLEAEARADRLRRETAEAERDTRMREAVVFKRRCKEAERALREQKRTAAAREAALRNRIRVLKATVRAMEGALGDGMRAETPMLDAIMREGSDEELFRSTVAGAPPPQPRTRAAPGALPAVDEEDDASDGGDGGGARSPGVPSPSPPPGAQAPQAPPPPNVTLELQADGNDDAPVSLAVAAAPKVTLIDRSELGAAAGPSMWRAEGPRPAPEDPAPPLSLRAKRREARLAGDPAQPEEASSQQTNNSQHTTTNSQYTHVRNHPAWPDALREDTGAPGAQRGPKFGNGRPLPQHSGRFINP